MQDYFLLKLLLRGEIFSLINIATTKFNFNSFSYCRNFLFCRTLQGKKTTIPLMSVALCEKFAKFVVLSNQQTYY